MAVFHFKESLMSALHKTFGSVEIKSLDEQKRTFKGVASTPNQDRAKDVMGLKARISICQCHYFFIMTRVQLLGM